MTPAPIHFIIRGYFVSIIGNHWKCYQAFVVNKIKDDTLYWTYDVFDFDVCNELDDPLDRHIYGDELDAVYNLIEIGDRP